MVSCRDYRSSAFTRGIDRTACSKHRMLTRTPAALPAEPVALAKFVAWATRRSRPLAWIAATIGSAGCLAAAGAQPTGTSLRPGHFVSAAPVPVDSMRRGCLALGDTPYLKDVPEVGACEALGVTAAGVAGGRRWFSALFARRWLLPASGVSAADTVAERELVLFAAGADARAGAGETRVVPVWHYRFEPEMLRSVTAEAAPAGAGDALVAIDECVNGTGGCAQTFFAYRGDRWRDVRAQFVDELNRRYPGALAHGFHVDLKTLRGSAALYSAGDPNCCPSRVAEMQLRLRRDALEIVELHVRTAR